MSGGQSAQQLVDKLTEGFAVSCLFWDVQGGVVVQRLSTTITLVLLIQCQNFLIKTDFLIKRPFKYTFFGLGPWILSLKYEL